MHNTVVCGRTAVLLLCAIEQEVSVWNRQRLESIVIRIVSELMKND